MTRVAFAGAGRMASAIVSGLLAKKIYEPGDLCCTSAADGTGEALAGKTGIRYRPTLPEAAEDADIVLLAFKPQQLADLGGEARVALNGKLVISILAGTPLKTLGEGFPEARALVRSMPNTPGQIGFGITCFATADPLTPEDAAATKEILGALGPVHEVDEDQLDAVTAVSGSGPAYVFEFVAGLRDAGIAAGLPEDLAYELARETVRGAAELLKQVPEAPETHRDWVSSPGGTTLAGLAVLEGAGLRGILADTVAAARNRSIELAKG